MSQTGIHKIPLKCLIFDLDGTLVDSAPDLRQAINTMLLLKKLPPLNLEETKSLIGDGMLTFVKRAFALRNIKLSDDEAFRELQGFISDYRSRSPDPLQIYPGGQNCLARFHKKGIKLAICTNKHEDATRRLLEGLHLLPYFSFVAGADTFEVHKPHPGHVLGILKALTIPPETALFVGDSLNDITAAHGAGLKIIGITHGYDMNLGEHNADLLIESFSQIDNAIDELGYVIAT